MNLRKVRVLAKAFFCSEGKLKTGFSDRFSKKVYIASVVQVPGVWECVGAEHP